MVFTKSYMVYLPEGYDGLVFAAELEEDNYEDFMKRKQQSDPMAESYIMDGDSEEPYPVGYRDALLDRVQRIGVDH